MWDNNITSAQKVVPRGMDINMPKQRKQQLTVKTNVYHLF